MSKMKNTSTRIAPPRSELDINRLMMCGVPRQVLLTPSFNLDDFMSPIEVTVDKKPKLIKRVDQQKFLTKILKDPLRAPYTLCISSYPTDAQAKLLAVHILTVALTIQRDVGLDGPKWCVALNNYKDKFFGEIKPSIMVISNITDQSTEARFEKLRDLLEYNDSIPRIVVTSGIDPITLFNGKLKLALSGAIFLKYKVKVNEI